MTSSTIAAVQSSSKSSSSSFNYEDESYWRKQVTDFKQSGLNRKAFCQLSDVNYDRFQYW